MNRPVTIATVQPPAPTGRLDASRIQEAGLRLLDEAVAARPDVVCLPEYSNCMGDTPASDPARFGTPARALVEAVAQRARRNRCYVILPVVVNEGRRRYNRAYLLDRRGEPVGHFDKVHLTQFERDEIGITAGRTWPVFDADFGRLGIMICYDGCFSESSRILVLGGAEVLFWPSLQRAYSEAQLELQARAHAYFNFTVVVRSSYGGPTSMDGSAEPMVGLSSICGPDGTMLARLQGRPGWTCATVDLSCGPREARTFGGQVGCLRRMRLEDRKPETYALLSDGRIGADLPPVPPPHTPPAKRHRQSASRSQAASHNRDRSSSF